MLSYCPVGNEISQIYGGYPPRVLYIAGMQVEARSVSDSTWKSEIFYQDVVYFINKYLSTVNNGTTLLHGFGGCARVVI